MHVLNGSPITGEGSAACLVAAPAQAAPRFDAEDPFDEAQSTHLWIVNRAAWVAAAGSPYGSAILALFEPGKGRTGQAFHDNLCQGLYDADFLYSGPILSPSPDISFPSYASHFYDPDTGTNWLGQRTWTALTEGDKRFWRAVAAYVEGDMKTAGYQLGLSLHYFTDLNQPMHAGNFTFLDSSRPGYHAGWETLVLRQQSGVSVPEQYIPSTLPPNPPTYLVNAAKNSKSKYYDKICDRALYEHYNGWSLTPTQQDQLVPWIAPVLCDAVTLTSQFVCLWMQIAKNELSNSTIVSHNTALVIDVPKSNKTPGTHLWQYHWDNTRAQRFSLNPLGESEKDYVQIIAHVSGLYLDVQNSTVDGAPVVQNRPDGSDSQKWRMSRVKGMGSVLFQNKCSGLYLTVGGGAPWPEKAGLVQTTLNNTNALRQWYVAPASPRYMVAQQSAVRNVLVIDVFHGRSAPGTKVQLFNQKRNGPQTFLWVPLGGDDDGYYMVINQASGRIMSVDSSNRVIVDIWNATDQQKWTTVPASGNGAMFAIQNKGTGNYLTANPVKAGTQLTLGEDGGLELTFETATASLEEEEPAEAAARA